MVDVEKVLAICDLGHIMASATLEQSSLLTFR